MLSMQNSSAFAFPSASDLENHHVIPPSQLDDRRNSTRSVTLSELPPFSDCPLAEDSLSHRTSISTDDFSDQSPQSWEAEGPSDRSPSSAEAEAKIHDVAHLLLGSPFPAVSANTAVSTAFGFNSPSIHEDHDFGDQVTPKVEEVDDADDLQNIKPLSGVGTPMAHATTDTTAAPVHVPRKRGRPRKHPLPVPGGQLKITKGRSKTGCITCRRRKKKCDETKPAYFALLSPPLFAVSGC